MVVIYHVVAEHVLKMTEGMRLMLQDMLFLDKVVADHTC